MKQKIRAFFYGRNGADTLSKAILYPALLLLLAGAFFDAGWLKYSLYFLAVAGLVYSYFRIFSRNLYKRQNENRVFREFFKIMRLKWRDRKTYRYYRCPKCREWMRVPRGRGSITITCRVCRFRFEKIS
ncbi:MAG: hypothetical protein IJD70_03780 [Clostridia bacterium]|nr:hypothetical protein [Clostridia bacterium]